MHIYVISNDRLLSNTFYEACIYNALNTYEHTFNALNVVMVGVMVGVNPNLAHKYGYTALRVHYNSSMFLMHYGWMH